MTNENLETYANEAYANEAVGRIMRRAVAVLREAVASGNYVLKNGITEADLDAVDERYGR